MHTATAIAEYAASVPYAELTHGAVHAAKARLPEALARVMALWLDDPSKIVRDWAAVNASEGGATVIGTRMRSAPAAAAFANTVMFVASGEPYSHGLESVPGLLALADFAGATGQDLVLSLVVAYDVAAATGDAFAAGVAGGGAMLSLDAEDIELALAFPHLESDGALGAGAVARDVVSAVCLAQLGLGGMDEATFPSVAALPEKGAVHAIESEAGMEEMKAAFSQACEMVLRQIQIDSALALCEELDEIESVQDLLECLVV